MDSESVRAFLLSLPHVTEQVQWGHDLVFKVGNKMFAVIDLEPGPLWLSCKCEPEVFGDLVERPGIRPARYLARAFWVSLESPEALSGEEIRQLLHNSYELVYAKLPRKIKAQLI
jgi:predicted DNA-binding protein (MmcQ/YjbR family)